MPGVGGLMAVHAEALELQLLASGSDAARRRFQHLRRLLFVADAATGVVVGGLVAAVAHVGAAQTLLLIAVLAVAWPLAAFVCGLYAREDLRAWSSGVSEAPKLVLTCLAISWPLFGLLVAMSAQRPAAGAFFGALACAAVAGMSRSGARMVAHRAPQLRQRTLIVGSGVVASRLAERIQDHPELGLVLTGYIDDHHEGVPAAADLPYLGALPVLSDLVALEQVDRVMIAFTRAHHEELLHALRVCRDAGVAVDVVPRLFEFLGGARAVDEIGGMPLLSIDATDLLPRSRAPASARSTSSARACCSSRSCRCSRRSQSRSSSTRAGRCCSRSGARGAAATSSSSTSSARCTWARPSRPRRRRDRQEPATTTASRASAGSSGASRSTRRRSCSTCSRAT